MANDPKAQRLATAHEQLAVAIQKRLDERNAEIARIGGLSDCSESGPVPGL
jgi:hypothetical protein